MKDLIDEKNRRDKMKRSIIKYWNVSYGAPEPIGGEEEDKPQEDILKDLPDDFFTAEEPETIDDMVPEPMDEVSQRQIEQILHEKDTMLRHIIEEEQNGTGE